MPYLTLLVCAFAALYLIVLFHLIQKGYRLYFALCWPIGFIAFVIAVIILTIYTLIVEDGDSYAAKYVLSDSTSGSQ